jgi:hypothetical protein
MVSLLRCDSGQVYATVGNTVSVVTVNPDICASPQPVIDSSTPKNLWC